MTEWVITKIRSVYNGEGKANERLYNKEHVLGWYKTTYSRIKRLQRENPHMMIDVYTIN